MELALLLLPIMGFIALAAGLTVVFRGTARIAAQTREIRQFQTALRDLAGRADQTLGVAAAQIDQVRHHQAGPELIGQAVLDTTETLERYTEEARSLKGPRRTRQIRDELVVALERASRAIAMVDHGATMLASARRGNRDLEAQTSIKRGYLNLIHAREAIVWQSLRADRLRIDERLRTPAGPEG